jgi:hypothetical protein
MQKTCKGSRRGISALMRSDDAAYAEWGESGNPDEHEDRLETATQLLPRPVTQARVHKRWVQRWPGASWPLSPNASPGSAAGLMLRVLAL